MGYAPSQTQQEVLEGILQSGDTTTVSESLSVNNVLPFDLQMFEIDVNGEFNGANSNVMAPGYPGVIIPASRSTSVYESYESGAFLLFTAACSGAYAAVVEIQAGQQTITINSASLLCPNYIGAVPTPNSSCVIPPDSQRVVVGSGTTSSGIVMVREQYWRRLPDSYTIAPGQSRTVSFTTVEGIQSVSSEQNTVATSLGMSASAGWGPISASVSASLSTTSTTFQQLTLTSESTTFVSETLQCPTDAQHTQMFIYWQLMDVINIVGSNGQVEASIVSGSKPIIVAGPYDPNNLPAPPVAQQPAGTLKPSGSRLTPAAVALAKGKVI